MQFRLRTLVWLTILGPPVLACPWWLPQLAGMAFMLAVSGGDRALSGSDSRHRVGRRLDGPSSELLGAPAITSNTYSGMTDRVTRWTACHFTVASRFGGRVMG